MNFPNNESGYGPDLGYSSFSQGSSDEQGYGTDAYGYGADGYGENESKPYGSGNSLWHTDYVSDGYRENVFEVNVEDTAYTETLSSPNPHISGYSESPTVEGIMSYGSYSIQGVDGTVI